MRVSSYAIGAPLQDGRFGILLHGLFGSVDKSSRDIAVAIAGNVGKPIETVAVLRDLPPSEAEHLRARGYLTDLSHRDEQDILLATTQALHAHDLESASPSMVFVPTYRCGLRCPYCFQSHDLHAGRGAAGRVMTRDQVGQAFTAIDAFRRPGALARMVGMAEPETMPDPSTTRGTAPLRSLGLFGGEPLGRETRDVVGHIVDGAARRGTNVWAITNGVELEAFADLLGPDAIAWLQVTFDGMAPLHDSRRRGPGFRKTFDRIACNVDLALQRGAKVSVRMNVDASNFDEVEKLTAWFAGRGWTGHPLFECNAAVVTGSGKGHKDPIKARDLVALTRRLTEGGRPIGSYEDRARDVLDACLLGDGYPFKRVANCSAETGQLMFDPVGDVYACWEDVGRPELRIGTYGGSGLHIDTVIATQWLTRFPGAIEQCSACPYALIHKSGCAAHAREATGALAASACEDFQAYFPSTLASAYSAFEAKLLSDNAPAANRDRGPATQPSAATLVEEAHHG